MSLKDKLDEIRAGAGRMIPPDKRAIMEQATADLRASGILKRVIKVGDALPAFALRNQRGALVQSQDVLGHGAVVLTVFRGHW